MSSELSALALARRLLAAGVGVFAVARRLLAAGVEGDRREEGDRAEGDHRGEGARAEARLDGGDDAGAESGRTEVAALL